MKTFAFVPAIVLAATMISAPASARAPMKCPAVSTAAVEAQFGKFQAAWATGNPDTVTALFAKDAVLLATLSNTQRTTHPEIREYFVEFLKKKPVGTIDTSTVKIDCRTASRVGNWTVKLTDPATGKVSDVAARYSFVYKYEGGKWMIDHLHSSVRPAA
jgi:uncharacterized protein (TIGR02246 family)